MSEFIQLKKGSLYIIATPIGNLSDISDRMRETIAEVDCLYAEDTRHTGKLCRHLGLRPQLRSLHDHNESDRVDEILARLHEGESLGLVSDAGTPLISDPGYRIVSACHNAGLKVCPVPGPSALVTALSVCGLPTDRFTFYGFLPSKSAARRAMLAEVSGSESTSVFFESRHRVVDALSDLCDLLGNDRRVCIARELTKTFETVVMGHANELLAQTRDTPEWQKGEFVLVIEGARVTALEFSAQTQSLLLSVAKEVAPRKAVAIVADHSGLDKKMLYDWLVQQKQ